MRRTEYLNNTMNIKLFLSFIILLNTNSSIISQEPENENLSKQELKLLKLEEKVKKAQEKVDNTQLKLDEADSLIKVGFKMVVDAKVEIAAIGREEKEFNAGQNIQLKALYKKRKKADEEEIKEIDKELDVLDSEYKNKIRDIEKRFNDQFKIMEKGEANQQKGKDKQKQYRPVMKEAQNDLEDAKTNLAEYKTEYGFD